MYEKKIIVISGPTASGKSFFGLELAKKIDGIIVNADSMQIYKGLPILSAQPDSIDQKEVEHRLYSFLEPNENNSVYKWLSFVKREVDDIFELNKTPIIVGGTGMYISRFIYGIKDLPDISDEIRNESIELFEKLGYENFYELIKSIDELAVGNLNKNDKQRLMRIYEIYKVSGKNLTYYNNLENNVLFDKKRIFHINLMPNREELYARCELRFELMLDNLKDEFLNFMEKYPYIFVGEDRYPIKNTLGFEEYLEYFNGKTSLEEMIRRTIKSTKNYAKRQYTWFRNQFKDVNFLLTKIPNKDSIEEIIEKTGLINNEIL